MANTAIIGIANWTETRNSLLDLAGRLETGVEQGPGDYHLNFSDTLHLLAELPPRRLDTLREIKRNGPLSVYAVAKHLARNYSNVHADVQKLVEHGLVEKDEQGRVFVPWDDIVVRVDASLLDAA
jgi:predicted transcriptional regulator